MAPGAATATLRSIKLLMQGWGVWSETEDSVKVQINVDKMCTVPGGLNVVGSVEGAVEGNFRTFSGTEEGLLVGD